MKTCHPGSDPLSESTPAKTELADRLRQQELVAKFGLLALRVRDLDHIMDEACRLSARGLDTQFSKVLRYRPESLDFLLTHGVGWRPGVVGEAVLGADLASPAGFALQTKLPVISTHLSQETRFRTPGLLTEHNVHRAINVIIGEEGGEPYGVLEADSSDRVAFVQEDVAFLQALANVLFAAIQRHRDLAAREQLLREKDVLMQEVHHRTKNSLQIVQTMLHLQARSIPDGEEKSRLQEAASRIMTIAAVHRQLHEEGAIERVELSSYLRGLLADISKSLGPADGSRPINIEVTPMLLAAEQATPVGLIAAELVTNALKYGEGPMAVRVSVMPGGVGVEVSDDGPGFAADYDFNTSRSLGMRLIVALARTPDPLSVQRDGTTTRVTVRVTLPELPQHG